MESLRKKEAKEKKNSKEIFPLPKRSVPIIASDSAGANREGHWKTARATTGEEPEIIVEEETRKTGRMRRGNEKVERRGLRVRR